MLVFVIDCTRRSEPIDDATVISLEICVKYRYFSTFVLSP